MINALARISPPCCSIAHQISDGRQKPFTLKERFIIRTHLMICDWCTSYSKQIALMSEAGRKEATSVESGNGPALQLTDSAREKLRRALEQRQ
jgi:hypothetical protein